MFPSNDGRNQQAFVDQHLFGDQSNSRNEPSLSSFHSWPSLDNGGRFLYHDHQLQPSGQASNSLQPLVAAPTNMQAKDKAVDYSTAKRSSGKIATAQGVRGRRMRLSVNIARKFFDLQDMLGFDKASQTVGWLLMKSKEAIKELSKGNVGVGLEENTSKEKTLVKVPKVKKALQSQKATVCAVARESRAIARAKARVRTREKMSKRLQESKEMSNGNTHNPKRLSSHSNHDKKSLEMGVEIVAPNKPIPSTFEHHQDIINNDVVNLFPENWVMDGTRTRWSCFDIFNMH